MKKAAAVVAIVVGVILLVAFALSRPFSRKPLDDYVAARKAAGKPVRLRDVVPADPPPAENGADDLVSAGEWMEKHAGPRDAWTVAGPWNARTDDWFADSTPEQLAELDRFLADAKPYFDGIDAAIAKGRIVPPPGDGADETAWDRRMGQLQLVGSRAYGAARPQDRLDGIVELAAIATRTESRALIDHMISGAMMTNAVRALRREMERGTLDVAAATARLDPFLAVPWLPRLRTAVRLERAAMLERVAATDFDAQGPVIRGGGTSPDIESILLERMKARIRAMIDGETIVRHSPADFAAAHTETEPVENLSVESGARAIAEVRALLAAAKPGGLAAVSLSSYKSITTEVVRTEARCRLARIALAVAALHARTGALPKSLDDLAAEFPQGVPTDPFTDAPFVLTATPAGIRIASAGCIAGDAAVDAEDLARAGLAWEWKR